MVPLASRVNEPRNSRYCGTVCGASGTDNLRKRCSERPRSHGYRSHMLRHATGYKPRQRWPRHTGYPALPRAQEHTAHHEVHRAGADEVQSVLAGLTATTCPAPLQTRRQGERVEGHRGKSAARPTSIPSDIWGENDDRLATARSVRLPLKFSGTIRAPRSTTRVLPYNLAVRESTLAATELTFRWRFCFAELKVAAVP
jgi:hypothetical protein